MIEDKELRDLFKVECSEHLQVLENGLLRLEKEPGDKATLEEVFREAHSLKGAARMVGVTDVETIGHKFEDILGAAKKGTAVLSSEVIYRLYKGLDSIKKLVNEAVTGEQAGVNVSEVIEQIAECGLRIAELKPETTPPSPQSSPIKGEEELIGEKVPSPLAGEGKGGGWG